MVDFSNIVKRGKKLHQVKKDGGKWGRCEECGERSLIYPYSDNENQVWMICEECTIIFVKEEVI